MPFSEPDEKRIADIEAKLADTAKETMTLKGFSQSVGFLFTVVAIIMTILGILGINKISDRDAMATLKPQIGILLTDALKTRLTDAINQISINASTDAAKKKTRELEETVHRLEPLQPDDQGYVLMKDLTESIKDYVIDQDVAAAEKKVTHVLSQSIDYNYIHPRAVALLASLRLYKKQEYFADDNIDQLRAALQEDGSISMLHNVLAIELVNRCDVRYRNNLMPDANHDLRDAVDHFSRVEMLDPSNEGHYKVLNNVAWAELNGLDCYLKYHPLAVNDFLAAMDCRDLQLLFKHLQGDLELAELLQPDQPTAYETKAELLCTKSVALPAEADSCLKLAQQEFRRSIERGFFDNPKQWKDAAAAKQWYRDDSLLRGFQRDQSHYADIDKDIEGFFAQHPRA